MRCFAYYLRLLGEKEIVPEKVRFIFSRSLPVNEAEQAQMVRDLDGIVPREELLPLLPFLRDKTPVKEEKKS